MAQYFSEHLSEGGLFVVTDQKIATGREVELRIVSAENRKLFEARGVVSWMRHEDAKGGAAGLGLKFTMLTEGAKIIIQRILQDYPRKEAPDFSSFDQVPERPTGGSFKLPPGVGAHLDFDEKSGFPQPPPSLEEGGPSLLEMLEQAASGNVTEPGAAAAIAGQEAPVPVIVVKATSQPSTASELARPMPTTPRKQYPETKAILGIDLGTTYSCAAVVRDSKPDVVLSESGYRVIPSVLSITENDVIVGWGALDRMITHPKHTIYGGKRMLGRRFESVAVQEAIEYYDYNIVPDLGYGSLAAEAAVRVEDRLYPLEWVSTRILLEITTWARDHTQSNIKRAVIAVPAYYNDYQRQAVIRAGEAAGLEVVQIVNEPTAASLAYGINRGFSQTIVVYDLGGGTFDVSVLELNGNLFEVLGTGGDPYLGGVDFDNRVVDWVLSKFRDSTGVDLSGEKVVKLRIRQAAEVAKRELSEKTEARIFLPFVAKDAAGNGIDLDVRIDRETFNGLVVDLVDRTVEITNQILEELGRTWEQVDEVLIVGGQTRTPLVQGKVHAAAGKSPRKGVHPDEAIAVGAALLGDSFDKIDSVTLLDVVSMPIGVALPGGRFRAVLPKNTSLPAEKKFTIGTTRDGQTSMSFDVYQGQGANIEQNEYLGTIGIDELPDKPQGLARVEFAFRMDNQGFLAVTARSLLTDVTHTVEMITHDVPASLVGVEERVNRESEGVIEIEIDAAAEDVKDMERAAADDDGKKKSLLKKLLGRD